LHTISDKEKKQNCLFLVSSDSIKGLLLDANGAVSRTYTIDRLRKERLLGGFIKEGKVFVYLYNNAYGAFHVMVIGNNTFRDTTLPFDLKKEKEVDRLSCGDHFMYFTVNRKSSELIIYDFHDEMKFDTLRYHFEEGLWQKLTKSNGNFTREINVGKVSGEGECGLDEAQSPNKLYFIHDSLLLLMNNERGATGVISFDMQHRQVHSWVVTQSDQIVPSDVPQAYSDNSFLLGGKLYYVQATFDSLYVTVNDFASGDLLKRYTTKRNEDISFRNTPIIQEGGGFSSKTTKELDKTRQLLRKMVNGRAVIIANRENNGRVVLTVGSYTEVRSGGGGGYFMGGGAPGGAPIFVPTGGFSRSWTKSARFKMLLDGNTSEHVDGDPGPSINEKIEAYTEGMDIPESAEVLFVQDGSYIYAFYDKKERKLQLIRF
jgi:hypothetical protein